jgi:hypothetical protein
MNKTFRVVWNSASRAYVAVQETAKGRSKSSRISTTARLTVLTLFFASQGHALAAPWVLDNTRVDLPGDMIGPDAIPDVELGPYGATIDLQGYVASIDSTISGPGDLALTSTGNQGVVILNNSNSYLGATSIQNTLAIATADRALGAGPVTVTQGSQLSYFGEGITAGNQHIANGGVGDVLNFVTFEGESNAGIQTPRLL